MRCTGVDAMHECGLITSTGGAAAAFPLSCASQVQPKLTIDVYSECATISPKTGSEHCHTSSVVNCLICDDNEALVPKLNPEPSHNEHGNMIVL